MPGDTEQLNFEQLQAGLISSTTKEALLAWYKTLEAHQAQLSEADQIALVLRFAELQAQLEQSDEKDMLNALAAEYREIEKNRRAGTQPNETQISPPCGILETIKRLEVNEDNTPNPRGVAINQGLSTLSETYA